LPLLDRCLHLVRNTSAPKELRAMLASYGFVSPTDDLAATIDREVARSVIQHDPKSLAALNIAAFLADRPRDDARSIATALATRQPHLLQLLMLHLGWFSPSLIDDSVINSIVAARIGRQRRTGRRRSWRDRIFLAHSKELSAGYMEDSNGEAIAVPL